MPHRLQPCRRAVGVTMGGSVFTIHLLVQQEDVEAIQAVQAAALQAGHGWDAAQQMVLHGNTGDLGAGPWVDGAWLRRVLTGMGEKAHEGVDVERVRTILDGD